MNYKVEKCNEKNNKIFFLQNFSLQIVKNFDVLVVHHAKSISLQHSFEKTTHILRNFSKKKSFFFFVILTVHRFLIFSSWHLNFDENWLRSIYSRLQHNRRWFFFLKLTTSSFRRNEQKIRYFSPMSAKIYIKCVRLAGLRFKYTGIERGKMCKRNSFIVLIYERVANTSQMLNEKKCWQKKNYKKKITYTREKILGYFRNR